MVRGWIGSVNGHIWVISYDGDRRFEEANAAYWASPKRDQLAWTPADYLVGEESRTVEQVL